MQCNAGYTHLHRDCDLCVPLCDHKPVRSPLAVQRRQNGCLSHSNVLHGMLRLRHGLRTRYIKLLGMRRECRERFPCHRGLAIPTCITTRAWRTCRDACRDRSLAVFIWSRWQGKRSRHSRSMRNPPFYVSGKKLMGAMVAVKFWVSVTYSVKIVICQFLVILFTLRMTVW